MTTAGKNNKTTSNRVALYGLLIALAFVLSYIETLFPVYMGAPGVKLGLANLVTVIALYGLGVKEAFAINLVRVILAGFTFGNMASILFGLAGAFLSLLLICLLYTSWRNVWAINMKYRSFLMNCWDQPRKPLS